MLGVEYLSSLPFISLFSRWHQRPECAAIMERRMRNLDDKFTDKIEGMKDTIITAINASDESNKESFRRMDESNKESFRRMDLFVISTTGKLHGTETEKGIHTRLALIEQSINEALPEHINNIGKKVTRIEGEIKEEVEDCSKNWKEVKEKELAPLKKKIGEIDKTVFINKAKMTIYIGIASALGAVAVAWVIPFILTKMTGS